MSEQQNHIHPIFDQLLPRHSKENLLHQHGCVLWFTGLSGSGKSTLAKGLEATLHEKGIFTVVLDGDNVRTGINNNLGFSEADRLENIRRIAEVAKLFVQNGVVVICCFVSPTEELRHLARQIIGPNDFVELYVKASLATCEQRDVKGLYAKARAGEIKDFTGISAPFEVPAHPDYVIDTDTWTIAESIAGIHTFIAPFIQFKAS